MGRQKARDGAVSMLKETLTRQFGTSLRDVVNTEVENRLAGRSRLERDDLEAIESSVLAASRQRRGGGNTKRGLALTRSTPNLKTSSSLASVAASVALEAPAQPPPFPVGCPSPPTRAVPHTVPPVVRHSSGKQPPGSAGSRSSQRSAPNFSLNTRALQPPFGLSIVDECPSERSHVQVSPKYPVPLRPKLKPMDHWDMIVAFDAAKHLQQVQAFDKAGRSGKHNQFKAVLDGQMEEIRGIQDSAAEEKRKESEDMLAKVEEARKFEAAEQEKRNQKKEKAIKNTNEMFESINQRKKLEQERKQQEEDQIKKWLEEERVRKEKEQQAVLEEHQRKIKQGREEMEAAYKETERKKKAQQDEDRRVVAVQQKAMDDNESKKGKALLERMEKIEKNTKILGAAIAARDAKMEKDLEERNRRALEESDRQAKVDAERKHTVHQKRVREMLDGLNNQLDERAACKKAEREEDKKQGEIWRQQTEAGLQEERDKAERARKTRENLDIALIGQIRENVSTHPHHFGMTAHSQKLDIGYNRVLYEQMASEGFRKDFTDKALNHSSHHSKLEHYPSVGRYEGAIHPLEMQVPDV